MGFFFFVSLMFYFLWEYIFSNIIEFIGTDIFGIGSTAATSLAIMKTATWISFIFLFLGVGGVYLIYAIVQGTSGNIKTRPLNFLYAIGAWCFLTPLFHLLHGIIYYMTTALNATDVMNAGMETTATTFAWILGLVAMVAMIAIPAYFILKGYGKNLFGEDNQIVKTQ